jgi:enterochelin esterase-like enzyme
MLTRRLCPVFLCLIFVAFAANAQPAAKTGTTPARRQGPPPITSPEVREDGTVTFRLRAAQAKEVTLSGEWGGQAKAMVKDAQGVWSVTVGALKPEIYGYNFTVDGFRTIDPSNPVVKPARSPSTSILEIPGDPPLLHEFQSVPHGTVHAHWYKSKSLGVRRSLQVYTPPGYDKGGKYPVLYLLHGSGDNDATWVALGRAHLILDNLLVQGRVKPMVVVMTDGHAVSPTPETRGRNVEMYEKDLLNDVMPFVEETYHVKTDRMNRAIVGLSMGGGQSLTIGLNHPEIFAWVGGFSSSVPNTETALARPLASPKEMNDRLKLFWFACGKDDFLFQANQEFSARLKAQAVNHQFVVTEGNHSWPVWRKYLAEFAPLLFTKK